MGAAMRPGLCGVQGLPKPPACPSGGPSAKFGGPGLTQEKNNRVLGVGGTTLLSVPQQRPESLIMRLGEAARFIDGTLSLDGQSPPQFCLLPNPSTDRQVWKGFCPLSAGEGAAGP